jgi:gluconate:H+ symporter, GntP family
MIGPLGCLLIGVGSILILILYFRFHAFLALITSALLVAFLSNQIPAMDAISKVTTQFGDLMAGIGILLAMAAIIGKCMMDSGAADRIVRAFSRLFGEERQHLSLLTSGYVLSIPVFFDTVFYLLAPLARAIYARTKRNYTLLICATATGGVITHALVPPTPGPLLVAEGLGVSIGLTILVGLIAGVVPAIVGGVFYAGYINKRLPLTPKDVLGVSQNDLEKTAQQPDSELPSLFCSFLPILLPVLLITSSTIMDTVLKTEVVQDGLKQYEFISIPTLTAWSSFIGNKNLVFFLGALISIWIVLSQKKYDFNATFKGLESAISSGAMIAFITCAGGSFGKMLEHAGVGTVIADWSSTLGLSLLTMAFLTAALIRIAQGSATVAMVTTVGIISSALGNTDPNFHIVFLIPMIGFGATTTSWMNDSGFWIVGQMTGISEKDTLKTWTVLLTVIAVSGYFWVLLLSMIATKIFPIH